AIRTLVALVLADLGVVRASLLYVATAALGAYVLTVGVHAKLGSTRVPRPELEVQLLQGLHVLDVVLPHLLPGRWVAEQALFPQLEAGELGVRQLLLGAQGAGQELQAVAGELEVLLGDLQGVVHLVRGWWGEAAGDKPGVDLRHVEPA